MLRAEKNGEGFALYEITNEYFYRIHHVRPRFKNQVENVLVFMATNVSDLGKMGNTEFKNRLNEMIKRYPGNLDKEIKTINNWRTEISSLFGLIIEDKNFTESGLRAKELTEDQDLVKFFKTFLFNFEYPGGHLKDHEIVKQCKAGIKFQPAKYILKVFRAAADFEGQEVYLTSAEVTHCIFNDLRCTRDNQDPIEVWQRIKHNREIGIDYDTRGDIIRYAGDILDYMDIANLLIARGKKFYVNYVENDTVSLFIDSDTSFLGYSEFIGDVSIMIDSIRDVRTQWFRYVNRDMGDIDFSTDLSSYLETGGEGYADYSQQKKEILIDLDEHLTESATVSTSIVGNSGESLIISHEKEKLRLAGRQSLTHLVNFIPTPLGVGYDIQSFERDGPEVRKYIEVKTTISSRALTFNSFHITPNEWRTARSVKDRYYIYRLQLSQHSKKLFILNDLYGKVERGEVQLVKRSDGFDVRFYESAGYEEMII